MIVIAHPDAYELFLEAIFGSNGSRLILTAHDFDNRPPEGELYRFAETADGHVAIHVRTPEEVRIIGHAAATAPGWKSSLLLTVPPHVHAQSEVTNISFGPENDAALAAVFGNGTFVVDSDGVVASGLIAANATTSSSSAKI